MGVVYAAMADELVKIAQYGPFNQPVNEEVDSVAGTGSREERLKRMQDYDQIAQEKVKTPFTVLGGIGGAVGGGGLGAGLGHLVGGNKGALIGGGAGALLGATGGTALGNWSGGGLDAKNDAIRAEIAKRVASGNY